MAKKEDKNQKIKKSKEIDSLLKVIDQGMSELYKDTYFSTDQSKRALDALNTNIDDNINSILSKRGIGYDTSNISKLIATTKFNDTKTEEELIHSLDQLFNNDQLMNELSGFYKDNNYIVDYDNQIDLICKYYSKLEDTVDTKIDNILSADHFTKDFINTHSNGVNERNKTELMTNLKQLRAIYNYDYRSEKWLKNIIKYGEQFLYIVPYKKAVKRLLDTKDNRSLMESSTLSSILSESTTTPLSSNGLKSALETLPLDDIEININHTGIISSIIEQNIHLENVIGESVTSLYEEFNTTDQKLVDRFKNKTSVDGFQFPQSSQDGLSDPSTSKNKEDIQINGAIVEELDRAKVKPIYIGNTCVGYNYIEMEVQTTSNIKTSVFTPNMLGRQKNFDPNSPTTIEDKFLMDLTKDIVKHIDTKFINANTDLKREIYLMLKYNVDHSNTVKRINVTFIPPEDMIHMYFDMDDKTHRGISELSRSIIPATLLIGMYLTNTIATMTRGQDKRVYYIKQNLEKNTAKTMINTVNQIKKNNFNFRSLNSIYNILDIVGTYNDFIIPMSQSGDTPVQFEIMQGQDIKINEELYNLLEEQSLNPTGVTRELIDARNSLDYAIQATMSNSKFLRKMLKKQGSYTPFLGRALTMIYNYEYDTKEVLEVSLPAPQILNLNNVNQIVNATNDYINTIMETDMVSDTDAAKTLFKTKMNRYILSSHMPYEIIDKFIQDSRVEASLIPSEQ